MKSKLLIFISAFLIVLAPLSVTLEKTLIKAEETPPPIDIFIEEGIGVGDGMGQSARSSKENIADGASQTVTEDVYYYEDLVRVSYEPNGEQFTTYSAFPDISSNGRYIVYQNNENIYRYDAEDKSTILITANSDGSPVGESKYPVVSNRGDVAYYTYADYEDTLATEPFDESTVLLYDNETKEHVLTQYTTSGEYPLYHAEYPDISSEGNYVIYISDSPDLASSDTNEDGDVFRYNHEAKKIETVSIRESQYDYMYDISEPASISGNGNFVAYISRGDMTSNTDVRKYRFPQLFVRNMTTGATEHISKNINGKQANHFIDDVSISETGRYVVFSTNANNLLSDANPENQYYSHVYLYDRNTHTLELISMNIAGEFPNEDSWEPSVSEDGRFVSFTSVATDLVSNDTNEFADVFVYDRLNKKTILVSQSVNGQQANSSSKRAIITADGKYISFESPADNLVPGDTNERQDIFVRKIESLFTQPAQVDVSVSVTDEPDPAQVDQAITYQITITNNGTDTATGVTVISSLSNSVDFISANSQQASCSHNNGSITCAIDSLSAEENAEIDIQVSSSSVGTILNTISVLTNEDDINSLNNQVTEETTVVDESIEEVSISITEHINVADTIKPGMFIMVEELITVKGTNTLQSNLVSESIQVQEDISISVEDPPSTGGGDDDDSSDDGNNSSSNANDTPALMRIVYISSSHLNVPNIIDATDNNLSVTIPSGTLRSPASVQVKRIIDSSKSGNDLIKVGATSYDISIKDSDGNNIHQFPNELLLEFKYEMNDLPVGSTEDDLHVFFWDEELQQWIPTPINQDKTNNTITAKVNHLTLFSLLAAPNSEETKYSDVERYKKEINFLTAGGIINGYPNGTFKPEANITRLQAIQVILRTLGVDIENSDAPDPKFTDMNQDTYGYKEAAMAKELGIISGKPDGTFDPTGELTRAQAAKIFVNAFKLTGTSDQIFKDVEGHWANDYINILTSNNITTGYSDGTFKPEENISREHFVLFLYRYLK
ncbi:DUF11 domain-containing protein [Bacillus sp. HMF5848]|uniref:S-layer homology domain-containing protein n=1 Tax=Bacillus sp. HMF5848 TaxID=2495421 RepID=UPI000F7AA94B|nr:S-layer homology domain-containing protein [Bacillus sp. HMF5848]RSK28302.1 DUF11 domain-containing protein [Bacillus sp. HMF5848]